VTIEEFITSEVGDDSFFFISRGRLASVAATLRLLSQALCSRAQALFFEKIVNFIFASIN
jgi:hypothetical protein